MNDENQQNLLVVTEQSEQVVQQARWQRIFSTIQTKHVCVILLLVFIVSGIGVARITHHKSNNDDGIVDQSEVKSSDWEWDKPFEPPLTNDNDGNDGKSKRHFPMHSNPRQRPEPPEKIGYMNIYIYKSIQEARRQPPRRFRVPAARYNRRRFPLTGPFLSFTPRAQIVADRLTRQTIIYSSTEDIYLLPPLVNTYGKLYSIAELIASGYASLVSTGIRPTGFIDIKSYFQPMPIIGPGMPTVSKKTGGFVGGMHTNYGSFSASSHSSNKFDKPSYSSGSERKKPPRYNNAAPLASPDRTASMDQPGEIRRTLIIDTIFPYRTSKKPVIAANSSFPGPLLEAYEGDTFIIRVINRLNVPSTIHWHGLFQRGTPDMDGAVGITQCAIPPRSEMIYKFKAEPAGTTWYHGHLLEQYTDGLYGPLIIRHRNEPNKQLYDKERVLIVADWYNERAHADLLPLYLNRNNPDGNEPSPDAIVVNGKFTQSLFISLSGSRRVRFRIINAAAFSMYTVSIDGLPLHIIEVDTTATFPYAVTSFSINVAQRVSFYIDLDELDSSYTESGTSATNALYIRFQASLSMYPVDIINYIPPYERQRYPYPTFFNPLYLAFLTFNSTNSTPSYMASEQTPTLSNAVTPVDTNLLDARPFDRNSDGIPSATHYLGLVIVFALGTDGINHPYLNNVTYSSDANYMHMRPDPREGITSDKYAPLLHQMAEKPYYLGISQPRIDAGSSLPTIQSDENGHYLVPYQAVVDIYLNNTDGGEHPFHLHGHNFWIIATSDYPEAETLYPGDYIQRDTVSVPPLGWAKIRFVANNPGAWFFHCHIEWHMTAGLALAFIISPRQLLDNGYTVSRSQKDLCQALRQFNTKY